MKIADYLVSLAKEELGTEEVDGSNCGPRVNQYKAATWLDPLRSWPWCAAFVCWCVREALAASGTKETSTFKRPRTAGALDLERWSLAQDASTWTKRSPGRDIMPGDIITYRFAEGGHCGVAISAPDKSGYFNVIEGNTNHAGSREGGGVFKKRRSVNLVHARIRFRI